ncbi:MULTISPECIES: YgeY family selenium metabolism-linked hydrolase [Clostridium]|uniref:Putative selenium metabolism hydrolase n=1 Tax=Clostridium cadaveris TaxID=1529 RepID=A0A1I2JX82_9CLOT|nr:YgeY family selenium metabolism-linked hydrolase [Clostridium cadaveris]MDU4953796.1 YgeY family selenium metabolism-linked hydrolase [Clostridium sp.]MDM8312665.1 YgeY family selenium metabolism-linked hydrolase [Clostridium cadaveris]MDY4950783.1 YgeY family selenium metabolism-linked hydrolase [Clostridium cadaveris]NWK10681.1 YgeY family selenium metabolism-linked hydrolase [Clostridium cadaveris]PWL54663.1 MAG: YgeY family selenium metabolism-linked hydrolase [Clostridium cadaveris]
MERSREEQVIELCQKLINEKSYSGHEDGVVRVLSERMKVMGFDEVTVDKYGNLIGCIRGNRPGKKILFDGHMDTVPVTEENEWMYPPFAAEIHDGKIYGRGTTDMKGSLSAMICAASDFANDRNKDFSGEIYVAGVVHEECFEGVAAREISKAVNPDYVVIGEASTLNLKIGQRGRAEIVIETIGKPCHSANPEKGINAVYKMAKVIEAIRTLKPTHHPVLGDGILELTDIKSAPYPGASVVPEYCRATYDRRLLVGETKESVLAPINELLKKLMSEDPELKVKAYYAVGKEECHTGNVIEGERFFPGWLFDKDEEFVQAVYEKLKEKGFSPEITQYNFCTNGSHYAGEAGIKTIGLGPSRENLAHTLNEYIEIDQLTKVTECYYGVIEALLK